MYISYIRIQIHAYISKSGSQASIRIHISDSVTLYKLPVVTVGILKSCQTLFLMYRIYSNECLYADYMHADYLASTHHLLRHASGVGCLRLQPRRKRYTGILAQQLSSYLHSLRSYVTDGTSKLN